MKCCTPAWLRCGRYLNLKSDVGDRIVEKSMKENRKKSYAGIKGDNPKYIENYIDSLVNSWLPEELNENLFAGVLVLLPDYPNNNWLTA